MRHFCRGGLPVRSGERVYLCRKPTLETVMLLLDLFGAELARLYLECRGDGADPGAALERFLEAFAARGDEAAAVLSTCCEGSGPPAVFIQQAGANRDLILECARSCLSQLDVAAVLEELPLQRMFELAKDEAEKEAPPPPGLEPDGISPMLAQAFEASPAEIVRWPYDGYLTAVKTLGADGEGDGLTPASQLARMPGLDVVH